MKNWTAAVIVALAAIPFAATEAAAAGQPAPAPSPETGGEGERFYAADVPPPIVREPGRLHVARPVFGSGYLPYPYPGFDTCPCDDAGCYHPGWYYCGGKAYRQNWCRRWLRAHFGHGSMLAIVRLSGRR